MAKKTKSILSDIAKVALGTNNTPAKKSTTAKKGKTSKSTTVKGGIAGALLGTTTTRRTSRSSGGILGALLGTTTRRTSRSSGGILGALLGSAIGKKTGKGSNVGALTGSTSKPVPSGTGSTGESNNTAESAAVAATPITFEKVQFGPYTWLVLDRKDDAALIITEGVALRSPYHGAREGTTWEDCFLRKHLNSKFLEKFDAAELERIVEVVNENPGNPWFKLISEDINVPLPPGTKLEIGNPKGGNPTKDKVFALSVEEVCRYFGDSTARLKNKGFTQVEDKDLTEAERKFFNSSQGFKGAKAAAIKLQPGTTMSDVRSITDGNDANRIAVLPAFLSTSKDKKDEPFRWWLRSPGGADIFAAQVSSKGVININGDLIWATEERERGGVRPVLWLKM